MVAGPEFGAVQLYHTECSPSSSVSEGIWSGSPASRVAATLLPAAEAVTPLTLSAPEKASLAGAETMLSVKFPS